MKTAMSLRTWIEYIKMKLGEAKRYAWVISEADDIFPDGLATVDRKSIKI